MKKRTIAIIINMPKSKIQSIDFADWYKKILERWGGTDYKLSRSSLKEELISLDENSGYCHEHGVVIPFVREPEIDDSDTLGYGEIYDTTPVEQAKLYIFENGEIYYIHEGYISSGMACYSRVYGIFTSEYDTSGIKEELELDIRMGKRIETEKDNPIKRKLIEKKKSIIIRRVKNALMDNSYSEIVATFDQSATKKLTKKNSV